MSDKEIQPRQTGMDLERVKQIISLQGWADALINGTPYTDPDPNYVSRQFMIATLKAATLDEVLRLNQISRLQKSVPDVEGATTGPIEVDDIYVTSSDFGEGMPTYVIFGGTDMEMGNRVKYSTGAQQVQAQFLAMINIGAWPIRCQVKRLDRKDRSGKHLFWVTTPD